eukprot:2570-Heterococcus_DN1.PRE.2
MITHYTNNNSGVLQTGQTVYNSVKGKNERIGRMLEMHANSREDIKEARAGDIVALAGLKPSVGTARSILINNVTDADVVPPLLARCNRTQQLVRHCAQRTHQSF